MVSFPSIESFMPIVIFHYPKAFFDIFYEKIIHIQLFEHRMLVLNGETVLSMILPKIKHSTVASNNPW